MTAARQNLAQPNTSREEKLVEFLKVIASLRDGHSSIRGGDRYEHFGYLPFTAQWFDSALYVTRAHQKYRQALGAKIIEIDGVPIAAVVDRLKTVVPHANESRFKKFSPYYLHLPGLLYGLGIAKGPGQAVLTLETDGGETLAVKMVHLEEASEADMINFGSNLENLPLYRQQQDKAYWFMYLEEEQLLYLNYNRVTSMEEESIWSFSDRLFQFIEDHEIKKMVVDIRDNGGGSGAYRAALWKGIQSNAKVNQRGKLFVITGYNTFSAAISFASYLELRTQAIFVGEGVCDHLISPGDDATCELPNSRVKIGLSKLFHEKSFYLDERTTLEPDFPLQTSFQDYATGNDPALAFIKNYEAKALKSSPLDFEQYLGHYPFSPYQYLEIAEKDGAPVLVIAGAMFTPLYGIGKDRFGTEVKDLELVMAKEGQIKLYYPDGKVRVLEKMKENGISPVQLIYAGRFEEAEQELRQLKTAYPDIQFWKDHSLAGLALEIYYDLKEVQGREEAKSVAKEVLNIAIRINPENHEFAQYSLRFY